MQFTCGHTSEVTDFGKHSFHGLWESDETGHWKECICGQISEFAGHLGEWTVSKQATDTDTGSKYRYCEICGYYEEKIIGAILEGFVLIKAGTFQMGSDAGASREKPVHEVKITKDFYMSKYEVTQGEYEKHGGLYGGYSPSSNYGDGENYPAYYVSWYDALVYCNKRSVAEGLTPCYSINEETVPTNWGTVPTSSNSTWDAVECDWEADGYRLPTEAEWEYAARAGDNTVDTLTYSGTNDEDKLGDYAWYSSNTSKSHEVGTKKANAFGLYDMSGNVSEWCWNWYTSSYDTNTEGGSNPTGALSGDYRVHRGGSWVSDSDFCSVSNRGNYNGPYYRSNVGFRVVRASSN